jgi:nucleoside-diphosphate-sugar epimerase
MARVILHLGNSRSREIAAVAVNVRGPVLVIGGAGYIGSHAVEQLLRNGYSVRVLDKLMYGDESLRDFRTHRQFEFIEGDATDIRKLTLAMRDASSVIHLAGLVGDPACAVDPQFTRHTNIVATRMAKDVAQALGVHKFIFASSCSVYGVSDEEVDEFAKLSPVSLYAQTKIDSEQELLSSSRDDFFVTVLRFATVFGHSRRPRFDLVANLFTAQAVTDGLVTVIGPHQWRPFVHVRDLARAIVMVLKADPVTVQSQVFNVGDARLNMTILQLAEAVRKIASETRAVEISVTDNVNDRRNYAVSFKKIRDVLGFQAETLMEDGIREMLEHFRHGDYAHYRGEIYSNVEMTKKALALSPDPTELMHIYAPIRVN